MDKIFARPRVFASKCLGFDRCRYNAEILQSPFVESLKPYVDFTTHCPEVEIGLGVPRKPIRVIREKNDFELFQMDTGRMFGKKMTDYSKKTAASLKDIDGFILKARSPSCGPFDVKVYPGKEKAASVGKTAGFFAREIIENFGKMAIEDEGRITNYTIRERFLIKIYAMADFRAAVDIGNINSLIDFHKRNKLMLMACNQKQQKKLGNMIGNQKDYEFEKLCESYREVLIDALWRGPRIGTCINVLMHALGYFKKQLSAKEKALFLDMLESYREKKSPLMAPVAVVKSWIARFENEYLETQTFFDPYPSDLVDMVDSGKGRYV